MASDMKSLTDVLTSVKLATMPHLYHVSRTTPMNLAVGEGPKDMKDVSSRPMSLNTVSTMVSQPIRTVTARRLSSNILSMTRIRHIRLIGGRSAT